MSQLPTPPEGDDVYHVYSCCFARAPERRAHDNFLFRGDVHDGPMPMDFNFWILRNAHRTVLVDTGFGPRGAAERHRPLDHDPPAALTKLGLPPETISDIILSHLHFDHAGCIERFPASRFHVQDTEVAYATGRCMCDFITRVPFSVEDVVTLVRHTYADRVSFHDGEAAPLPGITLHPLPGHSPGMQGVKVNTPRGPVFLCVDASHYYANFLLRRPFWVMSDSGDTLQSYTRIMEIGGSLDRIIPGHDPKVKDLYPAIIVNGVTLHMLHEAPRPFTRDELAAIG